MTGWQFVMGSLEGHWTLLASCLACTFFTVTVQWGVLKVFFHLEHLVILLFDTKDHFLGSFLKAQPCTRSQPAQTRYKQVWICRLTKSRSSKTVKVMKPNPLWLYLHTFYNISTLWPTPTYEWALIPAITASQTNPLFSGGFYEVFSSCSKYVALHFPLVGMNSRTTTSLKSVIPFSRSNPFNSWKWWHKNPCF